MRVISLLLAAALCLTCSTAGACTTILVGGQASSDGSRVISRTMDVPFLLPMQLVTVPESEGEGTWTFTDEVNGFQIELPVKAYQYVSTRAFPSCQAGVLAESCVNSQDVCISATETIRTKDKLEALDPFADSGIDERSIPTLVIPYVSSAREGVERLGELVSEYGCCSSEGVIFADQKEIWYMEMYTAHQWAAMRMPEDCYAVIANDAILGRVDVTDKENVIMSDGVIDMPKKAGLLQEVDGLPHLAMTYGCELRDYSQIRVWSGRRFFSESSAGEYDVDKRYDAFVKPESPIELHSVMELTRYRLEGTPYDLAIEGNNKRPIGIDRTAQSHVLQIRGDKPTVFWLCMADPELSVYLPLYGNIASIPEAYTLDCDGYDPSSAYWSYRTLASLAAIDREKYGSIVREHWFETEKELIDGLDEMDAEYEASGRSGDKAAEIFALISARALDDAHKLQNKLLTMLSTDTVDSSNALGKGA